MWNRSAGYGIGTFVIWAGWPIRCCAKRVSRDSSEFPGTKRWIALRATSGIARLTEWLFTIPPAASPTSHTTLRRKWPGCWARITLTTPPALPCGLDDRAEADHRRGSLHLLLFRLDWRRPDRSTRNQSGQQSTCLSEVPLLCAAEGRPHCGGESLPRARARALLGSFGSAQRNFRHTDHG